MGNYRLRLAVMASKGWLHKLREMGRARSHDNSKKKQHPTTTASSSSSSEKTREARQFSPRKSYYITRELVPDSPRKSSKQRARGARSPNRSSRTVVSSSISSDCSCQARRWTKPTFPTEYAVSPLSYSPVFSPEAEFRADCVLATNQTVSMKSRNEPSKSDEFPELELPPIITKAGKVSGPAEESKKTEHRKEAKTRSISVNIVREEKSSPNPMRRVSVSSPAGVRLRVNSPKLAQRRMQRKSVSWRRSLGESTAVVKSSADPQRDFRESMVEMIRANNIRGSKDLEDLLACYLSLNSDEYHHLIINVFKQIWFDLNHLP